MNSLTVLLKIQLFSWFGINKTIHTNNKKEKLKLIGFAGLMLFVGIFIIFSSSSYSFMMAYSLEQIDAMYLLLGMMMMVTCIFTIFTTIYKTRGILFDFKDYDTLMSLPIDTNIIVLSRLIILYMVNLFFSFFIIIPAGIVYAIKMSPTFEYYIIFIITFLFIPMFPIIIATAIGGLIAFISSKFKNTNIINLILTIVFFIGIMFLSLNTQNYIDDLANIGTQMMNNVDKIYPLATMYVNALCSYDIISLIMFIGISLIAFIVFSLFISWQFKHINTAFTTFKSSSNYEMQTLKQSSPFLALYKKELRRYFSSAIYVLNTGVGLILATIMSLGILIFGSESVEQMLELPGFSESINTIAPFAIATFVVMSCTTSASISLEGKNLWIIKSIPVKISEILMSKVAVNLTILLPAIFINGIILSYVLELSFINIIMMFITPTIYAIFISLFGLLINIYYPNFSWTSEVIAIKQSMSVLICILIGLSVSILPIVLIFAETIDSMLIIFITTIILGVVDIILYRIMITKGVNHFLEL